MPWNIVQDLKHWNACITGLDLTHKQLSVHPKFESFKHYLTFSPPFIVVMDTDIDGYKVKGWENDRL